MSERKEKYDGRRKIRQNEKIMHYDVGCEKIYVCIATLNSIDGVNIYNEK